MMKIQTLNSFRFRTEHQDEYIRCFCFQAAKTIPWSVSADMNHEQILKQKLRQLSNKFSNSSGQSIAFSTIRRNKKALREFTGLQELAEYRRSGKTFQL